MANNLYKMSPKSISVLDETAKFSETITKITSIVRRHELRLSREDSRRAAAAAAAAASLQHERRESGEPSGFNDNSPDDSADNPPAILADCGEPAALFSAPPISVMEVHFNLKGPSAG